MAGAMRRHFSRNGAAPLDARGTEDLAMLELMMIANMARSPLQVIARRWYCKGLFRATHGQRRCEECGEA
jgi:hypothetical protein